MKNIITQESFSTPSSPSTLISSLLQVWLTLPPNIPQLILLFHPCTSWSKSSFALWSLQWILTGLPTSTWAPVVPSVLCRGPFPGHIPCYLGSRFKTCQGALCTFRIKTELLSVACKAMCDLSPPSSLGHISYPPSPLCLPPSLLR